MFPREGWQLDWREELKPYWQLRDDPAKAQRRRISAKIKYLWSHNIEPNKKLTELFSIQWPNLRKSYTFINTNPHHTNNLFGKAYNQLTTLIVWATLKTIFETFISSSILIFLAKLLLFSLYSLARYFVRLRLFIWIFSISIYSLSDKYCI